jgi:hypothetical protein
MNAGKTMIELEAGKSRAGRRLSAFIRVLSHKPRGSAFFRVLPLLLLISSPMFAERKYFIGTTLDFTAGASNQAGQSSLNLESLQQGVTPFYSVYPSVSFKSIGRHSNLDLNYIFSGERIQMTPGLTTIGHNVTASFSAQLGNRTHLRLSDTFNTMPDYSTVSVLKGLTVSPEGFRYVFEPQLYRSSNISDNGSIGFDVDLTTKSSLTFGASGSYRYYEHAVARSALSNQLRTEGSLGFAHKHSERTTWNLKYAVWQNDYQEFATVRSHSATLGLSKVLRPGLDLTLEAGPSYTEAWDNQKAAVGYLVSASISKRLRTNRFNAGYSHRSADSTGLGGATDSHQGTLGFSQSIGRTTSLGFQASAFRQNQGSTDAYNYWGVNGSISLSQQLGRYLVASLGSSYTTYVGGSSNNYGTKRWYVSLGYRLPELWRIEK